MDNFLKVLKSLEWLSHYKVLEISWTQFPILLIQEKSDLDIVMSTGGGSPFYNYESTKDLTDGISAKSKGNILEKGGYKDWFLKEPTYYR